MKTYQNTSGVSWACHTPEEVAKCLYTINKEAKACRDSMQSMYYQQQIDEFAAEKLQELGLLSHDIGFNQYGQPFVEDFYGITFCNKSEWEEHLQEVEDEIEYAERKLEKRGDELSEHARQEFLDEIEFDEDYIEKLEKLEDAIYYMDNHHEAIKELKREKCELYKMKEKVLSILGNDFVMCHHMCADGVRPLYEFGGFSFHGGVIPEERFTEEELEEMEEIEQISAENTLSENERIPIEEAKKIVNDFIARNLIAPKN